jgi:hypothetical protein
MDDTPMMHVNMGEIRLFECPSRPVRTIKFWNGSKQYQLSFPVSSFHQTTATCTENESAAALLVVRSFDAQRAQGRV